MSSLANQTTFPNERARARQHPPPKTTIFLINKLWRQQRRPTPEFKKGS
jgi:hypothetical protein